MLRASMRMMRVSPRLQPVRWAPPVQFATRANATVPPYTEASTVTLDEAKNMPRELKEFPNATLLMLAARGDHGARAECVVREIMAVDGQSWEEAQPRFAEIEAAARSGLAMTKFPYQAAIVTAVVGGFATFPLCFDLATVEWFNEAYVTADHADAKDLETPLEVGSWSWNWMEPPLGQLSFFLLTLQYARSQMQNIGLKPYTEWLCHRRGDRLAKAFPQYNGRILHEFAHSTFTA